MSLNDPTREEMGQQLLMDAQQEYIPQGGVSPEQYVNQQMPMQYQTPQGQAELYQGLLGAGYTDQQAKTQIGLLSPDQTGFQGFENKNQFLTAEDRASKTARTELAPTRAAINYWNQTAQIRGGDVEKWTGADDFKAMRNFLKQSLPNESVMGDDLANLRLASGGLPGWAQAWIARLQGKGEQGLQARKDLLTSMKETADVRAGERDILRDYYTRKHSEVGFDPSRTLLPSQDINPIPVGYDIQTGNNAANPNYSLPGTVRETPSGVKYKILK